MNFRSYLALSVGLIALALPCRAASFYVSKTGSDSNPGTAVLPFLTIQKGLNTAQPGDRIMISAGIYGESVSSVRGGTAGAAITLDGQGVATVSQIKLSHPYQRVQSITISGCTNSYQALLSFRRGAHFAFVSNVVIDAASAPRVDGIGWDLPATKPFGTDAASNCQVVRSRVTRVLGRTAVIVCGDNNLIADNEVRDVGQADFVRLWGRNNIIRGNTFSNNFAVAGIGNHMDFIQTFGNSQHGSWGNVIEQNRVMDMPSGQLSQLEGNVVPEIGNWTFRNNIFIDIGLQASCTIPGVAYYNNVFYRCNSVGGSHPLSFGSRAYIEIGKDHTIGTNFAHGCTVFNNVFLGGGDSRAAVGWYGFSQVLTNVAADYNYVAKLDYGLVEQDAQHRPIGNPGGWATWGGWWEPHGINGGNPNLANPAEHDFRLLSGSPLQDRGQTLASVPLDIAGTIRPQGAGWDIGAYEFVPAGNAPPAAPRRVRLRQN